ncbi:DUF2929 family protein [Acetilactobacillus jinshanensis]|uniref:DUF2929 family protein n=1 Tax=Acetilactobacillus jinshanensis TaxID=1720083 RepID=A0A4V1ALL3_9LACO|nr:DUF2929 family protein [Acetilactobacillus jinshanensis]QBP17999.1 DUF2929 family protein [Acetilactobacillus jinshanensis]URL60861.1 DUF2929 family protein [uncultured bacterium]
MRFIAANLTVIVWAFIFGMIIGYIGSALVGTPLVMPVFIKAGIIAVIVAVVATNGLQCFINKSKNS